MSTNELMETVSVHMVGDCPQCGITNNAAVNYQISPDVSGSVLTADARCGDRACQARVKLVGHATR